MKKEIVNSKYARKKFLIGINKLCDTVACTLGPCGRNVILESEISLPIITNDGATIAREIELNDPIENIACSILKESSLKTNDIVGDGTTTSLILSASIFKNALAELKKGYNPILLKKDFENVSEYLENLILDESIPVTNSEQIKAVATISSESEQIGSIITDIISKIGKNGAIIVNEGESEDIKIDIIEGMKIDNGFMSSYMCDDELSAQFSNSYVLITDKKINDAEEVKNILKLMNNDESLLIVADDIADDALSELLLSKLNLGKNIVAIKAPSYGNKKIEILKDACSFVNAKFISKDLNIDISTLKKTDLGCAKSIKVYKDYSIMVPYEKNNLVKKRIKLIEQNLMECTSSFEKEELDNRLANLTGGVAFINVGGHTNIERLEKKLRVDDAVNAVKAAYNKGVVSGGGTIYLEILNKFNKEYPNNCVKRIMIKSLMSPFKQNVRNSGRDENEILKMILKEKCGYNILTGKKVNMIEEKIIDPTLVAVYSLKNAISAASILLTMENVVLNKYSKEKKNNINYEEI